MAVTGVCSRLERSWLPTHGVSRPSRLTLSGEINALREEFDEDEAYVDASFEDYDDWFAATASCP